jgi:hypothetical protein
VRSGVCTDQVEDVRGEPAVEIDEEVERRARRAVDRIEVGLHARRRRQLDRAGGQLAANLVVVGERKLLGGRFEEEVERVEDGHLGDEVDLDAQLARRFREDEAGEVVGLGILLPVHEVAARKDVERVGQDARAAVRCRAQAHDLRAEMNQPVVAVARDMVQRNMNRHR